MKQKLATLIVLAGIIAAVTPSNTLAGGGNGGKPAKTKNQGGGSKPSAPAGKDEINLAHVRGSNSGKGKNNPSENPNQKDDCNGNCGGNFSYEDYLGMKSKIREYKAREKMDDKDCVATRKAINGDYRAQYKFYQALQRQKGVGKVTQGTATAKLPGALFFKIPFEDKKGVVTTKTYPSTPACYRLIMNQYYGTCQTFGEKLAPGVENRRFENKWSEVEFSKEVIAHFDKDGNVNTCEAIDEKVVNKTSAPIEKTDGSIPNPDQTFEGPQYEAVATVAVGNPPAQQPVAETAAKVTDGDGAKSASLVEGNLGEVDKNKKPAPTTEHKPESDKPKQEAPAVADNTNTSTPAQVSSPTLEDLKKQLAEKDAKIAELETKIKALEQTLEANQAEKYAINDEIGKLRIELAECQRAKKGLEEKVAAPVASTTKDEVDLNKQPEDQKAASARRTITINLTGVNLPSAEEITQIAEKLSEKLSDADVIINITNGGHSEQVADNTSKPEKSTVPSTPTNSTTTDGKTGPETSTTSGSLVAEEDLFQAAPDANDQPVVEQPVIEQPEAKQPEVTAPAQKPVVAKPPKHTAPRTKPVVSKPKKSECEIAGTCFSQTFNLAVTSLCKDTKTYKGGSCQFVASVVNNKNSKWYKDLAASVKKHGDKMTVDQLRDEGFFDSKPGRWWEVQSSSKTATNAGYHFSLDHKTVSKKSKVLMKVKT